MLPTSKQTKQKALELLKGKWPLAISAVLIPVVISMILVIISQFFHSAVNLKFVNIAFYFADAAAVLLLILPLFLGTFRFFSGFFESDNPQILDIFVYFSSKKMYLRALKMSALVFLRLAVIGFFLMLPSLLTDFVSDGGLSFLTGNATPIWFGNLWIISLFLRGIAVAVLIFIVLKYYMVPYIFVINDSIDLNEAMYLSSCVSAFSLSSFAGLFFSLLGWVLLSFLVLPLIFTLPYLLVCCSVHCGCAAQCYNRLIKNSGYASRDIEFEL